MRQHIIIKYIKDKIKHGYSPLIVVCGGTNKGKSMTALSLALELDKKFNVRTNLFIDIKDFILRVLNAERQVFIIDEAKVFLDSAKWWSEFNQDFGNIIATQRYKNNVYIVVLPIVKKLAKEHRNMIDIIIEMKQQGYAYTYLIKRRWSELREFELWRTFTGAMFVSMPPEKIVNEYKEVEAINKTKVMIDMVQRLIKIDMCACGKRKPNLNKCEWCGERVGFKNGVK